MKTVYKYALTPERPCIVQMPYQARVVHVGEQADAPVLWAEVDTDLPIKSRHFYVFGTGHEIPARLLLQHVGTVQIDSLVWHVFEEIR